MAGLGRGLGSLLGEQKKIQEERKKESVVQTTAPVEEQAQVQYFPSLEPQRWRCMEQPFQRELHGQQQLFQQ